MLLPGVAMRTRPGRSVTKRRPSGAKVNDHGTSSPVSTVSTRKPTPSRVVMTSPAGGVEGSSLGQAVWTVCVASTRASIPAFMACHMAPIMTRGATRTDSAADAEASALRCRLLRGGFSLRGIDQNAYSRPMSGEILSRRPSELRLTSRLRSTSSLPTTLIFNPAAALISLTDPVVNVMFGNTDRLSSA